MKLLLSLYFVFATSGIDAYVTELREISKLVQNVQQYMSECVDEAAGDNAIEKQTVRSVLKGDKEDDGEVEKVTRCFFHKAGILQSDGTLNEDAAMSTLSLIGMKKNAAKELLEKCTSVVGYNADDMAYVIFKCFNDELKRQQV